MSDWGVPTEAEVDAAVKAVLDKPDIAKAVETLYGTSREYKHSFREAIKATMFEGGITRADGEKWGQSQPSAAILVRTKDSGLVATVMPFEGERTTFYGFIGPYMGTLGSDTTLWLAQGAIKRRIPYAKIARMEFDKSLGDKYHERPKITLKDGTELQLKEGEVVVWVGYGYKVLGKDENGIALSVSTRDVKFIEIH